jgi:hypothetical protein
LINSAFLARQLLDLYAGEICSVYRAHHRISHRNEESPARNYKPIIEDKFDDDKANCRNEESTTRNDNHIVGDEFEDDKDDCHNEESTARINKPLVEDELEATKTTVATKNPPQGTTSPSLKMSSKTTTTTNDKPIVEDKFKDDKDDCRNKLPSFYKVNFIEFFLCPRGQQLDKDDYRVRRRRLSHRRVHRKA